MTKSERACQIWSVLAWVAKNRQSMTYNHLSKLIGVPAAGLGQLLEPIQSFCIQKKLPPLTILVVQQESGLPGSGFIGAKATEFAKSQLEVFEFDWLKYGNPQPEGFEIEKPELKNNRTVPPLLWNQALTNNKIVPPSCNVFNAFREFSITKSLDNLPQYKKQNLRDLQFHKLLKHCPNLTDLPDFNVAIKVLNFYKMNARSDLKNLPRPIKNVFLVGWAYICGKNRPALMARHLHDSGFGGTMNSSIAVVTVGKSTGKLFGLLDDSAIPTELFYDFFELDQIQNL